ncbi:polysaccharide deacetylase family protein [Siccirubricoccus sp. KC 17139]|uniref:Polysaccharide deacetylase family protein n=1 Tax=Siccirubricoccus soli TaxID=2899147 RepID=A0ABT1D0G3_9PROT|nr:polysaccharide deacetylase family protein [Siccirubricoccus soli]MCO6415400.1 polysaccharide deacetylase family protein [Siccirubricoccus soli]MCP2681532.1 polysaccharide deacetylase family protein [Siccirubricoccus soli]
MLCGLAVDAEEDFDWAAPVQGTSFTTDCMHRIRDLQVIAGAYGIRPTYLLTYPVLQDAEAVAILRRYLARGECDVGVQLHPWVTPPFEGGTAAALSYSGNLDPALEAKKLGVLSAAFRDGFGCAPEIYRAGRYGLSRHTTALLEELGFRIDTSLAPRTDFSPDGGPDYSEFDYRPFWFGGDRPLLELPLCRSIVGWGGRLAGALHPALAKPGRLPLRIASVVAQTRFAERITLSPEGNDLGAMMRLVKGLRRRGVPVLVLSFHSSSLMVGRSPYVRSRAELHHFYDRLSAILAHLAAEPGLRFARIADIPALLGPPAA